MACDQKAANLAVSRIIPVVLGGLIGYACYFFTKPFCIDYLISPRSDWDVKSPRPGTAAGLLFVFYFLLLFLVASYLRLITTILFKPGYLPRGPQWKETADKESKGKSRKGKRRSNSEGSNQEKRGRQPHQLGLGADTTERSPYPFDSCGLQAFYMKDVFVCENDGRPPWCSHCQQFKSDRSHHCREVGRCVRKMDHFCPWVGGVVSETSFKFFIQFLFYTLLFTAYIVIVMAVFVAELRREIGTIDIQWIVALALGTLFGLFALGMILSSVHLALVNSSTIESLNRHSKVWTIAVLIPRPQKYHDLQCGAIPSFPMVSYPGTTSTIPSGSASGPISQPPRREFAILSTQPGENPFDLGSQLANMNEVMGYSIIDWLLPVKHSPCASHDSQESAFRLGPVVDRLRKDYGLDK